MGLLNFFRRPAPAAVAVRSLDAARPATRRGLGHFGAINGEVTAAGPTVRSRARHAAMNQPHLSLAVDGWVTELVGSGPRPTTDDTAALARWADWERREGFCGKLALAVRSMVVEGEALAVMSGDRLTLLPIEQLSDFSRPLSGGREIVNGIEIDSDGEVVGYWIHPGRHESGQWSPAVRVDAADVLHMFRRRPGSCAACRG
jgi:hypothetical protein